MEEVERERAAFAKERALKNANAKAAASAQMEGFNGAVGIGVGAVEQTAHPGGGMEFGVPQGAVSSNAPALQPGEVLMDLLFKGGAVEPDAFAALGEEDIVGISYAEIPSGEASPGKNFARSRAGRCVWIAVTYKLT